MVIERVEITNFRSLKKVVVDSEELTVIIGRNGSGKSSFLRALSVFYEVSFHATQYDYFAHDTDRDIEIRVTYGQLRLDELIEFESFLTSIGQLIVTKRINKGGARYYGASKQIADFADIRKLTGAKDKTGRLKEIIEKGTYAGLAGKVTSAAVAEQIMVEYEQAHPELLAVIEKEQQFFGPSNVGGGKLDKYTKFVLVPAVRDAAAEVERKGVILQLIDVLVARSINTRSDVRKLNEEFDKRVKEVYNTNNLTELTELATRITKLLAQYAPGAELNLSLTEIVPPTIGFPAAEASLREDNFKCPISYTGHGLQRALILALLQQLSLTDLSPQESQNQQPDGTAVGVTGAEPPPTRVPDLILAIEEPELYLHPSRSRFLAGVLNRLTKISGKDGEARAQVFYATHSPYFIQLSQFDKVRLARKVPTEDDAPLQCKITTFTRQDAANRLAEISGKPKGEFTAESFVAHATPVMNSIVNEGFFADTVLVVEGLGEIGAFWAIQELLNKNWEALGIVVVPAGGKNNIDRPVVVFRGLGIPTYFVLDGDASLTGKHRENAQESNQRFMRLANVAVIDFPPTQVHEEWAMFHDKLEKEIESIGSALVSEIKSEVAEKLGIEPSRVLKNPDAAAEFIRKIYDKGKRVEVLEKIVNAVTNLREKCGGSTFKAVIETPNVVG